MELTQDEVVNKLRAAGPVMLTAVSADSKLLAHPMTIQQVTDNADIYFFVSLRGDQAEIVADGPVNVAVADSGAWLSVAGTAAFVRDQDRINELFDDKSKAFFSAGPTDPNLDLLLVTSQSAQFWGVAGGPVSALASIVKAKMTGSKPAGGTDTTEL